MKGSILFIMSSESIYGLFSKKSNMCVFWLGMDHMLGLYSITRMTESSSWLSDILLWYGPLRVNMMKTCTYETMYWIWDGCRAVYWGWFGNESWNRDLGDLARILTDLVLFGGCSSLLRSGFRSKIRDWLWVSSRDHCGPVIGLLRICILDHSKEKWSVFWVDRGFSDGLCRTDIDGSNGAE